MFIAIGSWTTEIYTLSLHDALPICVFVTDSSLSALDFATPATEFAGAEGAAASVAVCCISERRATIFCFSASSLDRKSTRLNSSHGYISYAVFCLKKKSGY